MTATQDDVNLSQSRRPADPVGIHHGYDVNVNLTYCCVWDWVFSELWRRSYRMKIVPVHSL